jgi:competence protein ComFC
MSDGLRQTKAFILDVFLPNRCPFCDGFIKWDKLSCEDCYCKIEWFAHDEPTGTESGFYAAAFYTGVVKDAIIKLKYFPLYNFARIAANEIASQIALSGLTADCVVPVPMGKKKQRKAGYNHSEIIADEIAALLKVKKRTDCIFKHDSEKAQHTLSAEERADNVKGQYFASADVTLESKTVLLCDDVVTTGSTVAECARLLKGMGAEKVLTAAAAVAASIVFEKGV